jgi:hypothetical protein
MNKQKPGDQTQEPTSYFLLERRRRQLDEDKGSITDDYPQLPASSPWSRDPVPAEPLIDRTEDQ